MQMMEKKLIKIVPKALVSILYLLKNVCNSWNYKFTQHNIISYTVPIKYVLHT